MTSSPPSAQEPPGSLPEPPGLPPDDGVSVSPRVRNGIAIAITAVWALGMVADAAMSTFKLDTLTHATMLGLAAAVFGSNFVKGIRP